MLTTRTATGLRARPLEARPDRDNGIIWFVTDLRSGKEHEIERDSEVGLVFIDPAAKVYLSLSGRAEALQDHAKAARSGKAPSMFGGTDPMTPMSACCASFH